MAKRGIHDLSLLDEQNLLDLAIVQLGYRVLKDKRTLFRTFMTAFDCRNNWNDVAGYMEDYFQTACQIKTLEKYAKEIEDEIVSASGKAEELNKWELEYRK